MRQHSDEHGTLESDADVVAEPAGLALDARDQLSVAENKAIRVFGGSCALAAAVIVFTIVLNATDWTAPRGVMAFYLTMVLWLLVAAAYAFYSLLQLARQLKEFLRRKSLVDPLTGAFNIRYLEHRLRQEQERTRRNGGTTAVLFVDLDGFKEVNDRYGHQVGNEVLRGLTSAVSAKIRASDVFCRLGGDEFVLLMPGSTRQQAAALAERIRSIVEHYVLTVAEKEVVDFVRASVGVAVFPDNSDTMEGALTAADRAVYEGKKGGGNVVCVSEEFVATPAPPGSGHAWRAEARAELSPQQQ